MPMFSKIVLAIPHSIGTFNLAAWSDPLVVSADAKRWTDWHTDRVFASNLPKVEMVVGRVSRFDCDLERLIDDPLEAEGRGILYTTSHSGATRNISASQRESHLEQWRSYRNAIKAALVQDCLLIDCHSFPSDIANVDICLGFNDDWSKPTLTTLEITQQHFTNDGLTVAVNCPFSNSITPECDFAYKSLMIELNKRIYLCEETSQLLPRASTIALCLNKLYSKLLRIN